MSAPPVVDASTPTDESDEPAPAPTIGREWWRTMRVVVVAGIATGMIVVGLGSRLAMFALRATSHDRVIGRQSDDDFTIGRFTFSGTYNLVLLGAAVGVIGRPRTCWCGHG